ncbi:MAG: hypothetical protein DHS20C15_04440 [Planctomycetota bacterium]|nr:MAG: hypothetical protein DHS20C15_04440 [Planctomycetota bacterium]
MLRPVSLLVPLAFAALLPALNAQILPSPPEELLRGLIEPLPSGEGLSCALADLDGDGNLDAVTMEPSSLTVLLGRGDASFGARHTVPLNVTAPQHWPVSGPREAAPIVADLNHDGELDVLVLQRAPSADARVLFLAGRGGGRLAAGVTALELEGLRAADVGDFDGDGRLDLVLARTLGGVPNFAFPPQGPTRFFVALGNGDGSFQTPSALPLLGAPLGPDNVARVDHVFAADVDADGSLDVIAYPDAGPSQVATFLGQGDGSFAAPSLVTSPGGGFDVVLADLDADGDLDLVSSPTYSNFVVSCVALTVHRWDAGTFGPATSLPLCAPGEGVGTTGPLAVADFDGDGHTDILCSGWDSSIPRNTLLAGDGFGGFATPRSLDMPAPRSLAVGDLDADGAPDLIAVGGPPSLTVARNDGGAVFSNENDPLDLNTHFGGGEMLALDVDRDGDTDLLTLAAIGMQTGVLSLLNDGSGAFPGPASELTITRNADAPLFIEPAAGDLDGDGITDLALSLAGDAEVRTLLGGGPDLFTLRGTLPLEGEAGPIALGDLDLDGDLDAAVGQGNPAGPGPTGVVLLENDGTGLFTRRATLRRPAYAWDVELADLDGDGTLELLTLHGDGIGLAVARGDTEFRFREPVVRTAGRHARSLLVVDLDGDTQLDALVTDAASQDALVFPGIGGAGFGAAQSLRVAPSTALSPGTWPRLTLADMDADGLPDLVSRHGEGVSVRLRLPRGGFAPLRSASVNFRPIDSINTAARGQAALADFDGDGDLDVAVSRHGLLRDAVIVKNLLVP